MGNCAGMSSKKRQQSSDLYITDNSITVYHGTTKDASQKILESGFITSKNGGRGEGVYFTNRKDIAHQIAAWRGKLRKNTPVVLQCKISQNSQSGYHGPWKNCTTQGFTEYVVKDPKSIKIIDTY